MTLKAYEMLFDKTQDQSIEVLQAERDRLENSCRHLQRSNIELAFAQEEGPDPDCKQAIEVLLTSAAVQLWSSCMAA